MAQARSLLCTRSDNEKTSNELKLTFRSSLSPIVNCNIPITTKTSSTPVCNEIEQQMEVDQVEQDGQHLIYTSACNREDNILDTEVTHQEMDTLSELGMENVLGIHDNLWVKILIANHLLDIRIKCAWAS